MISTHSTIKADTLGSKGMTRSSTGPYPYSSPVLVTLMLNEKGSPIIYSASSINSVITLASGGEGNRQKTQPKEVS